LGLSGGSKKVETPEGTANTDLLASSGEIAEAVRLAPYLDVLKLNLSVEPIRESRATVKDTRLIDISYQNTDPNIAALVVNGIAETFAKQNQERKTGTNKKTNDFLQERVASLQAEIKADELKVADLKRGSGIINLTEDQTLTVASLSALNEQLLDAKNKREIAQSEYEKAQDQQDRREAVADEKIRQIVADRELALQNLKNKISEQIAALESEKAKLLLEFQPGSREIQEIDRKVSGFNRTLAEAVEQNNRETATIRSRSVGLIIKGLETRYLQAKAQEEKARAAFARVYDEAQAEKSAAINIRLLEQNIETNKKFLENLSKQQSENDILAQGSDNNISVAEIGLPAEKPIGPRRLLTVLFALIFSTVFGCGLALVLEHLDDTIKTVDEAERVLQLPALASIPSVAAGTSRRRLLLVGGARQDDETEEASSMLINADPRSSLSESYRQLRTSLLLSSAGQPPQIVLVTSSLPAEGKTTTAVNTAISLAQTGARVLIIDADMRRPRVHSVLEVDNSSGLSTLLSSATDEDLILETISRNESADLFVLGAGPIPPNPAELLGSEQMGELLSVLRSHFTHIVIDSPPIASFTDGVLLSSMVDGVLLVIHAEKSARAVVRRAKQFLDDVGARIFGVVFNHAKRAERDETYYRYYHEAETELLDEDPDGTDDEDS